MKKKYTRYYFQYRNSLGKLQSSGNQLLLDSYLVRWDDIKDPRPNREPSRPQIR